MKLFAQEVTSTAIRTLAERRAAQGLRPLEAADAVWVCHALLEILQPFAMPNATPDELAAWFSGWLPDIEASIGA